MRRVIFIPFRFDSEFGSKSKQWRRWGLVKGKIFEIHHYSRLNLKWLTRMNDGRIWVRGHGAKNCPRIHSGSGFREIIGTCFGAKDTLSHKDVADRLIAMGLRSSYAGKIKLFSCYSGIGENGFAQRIADYMYHKKGFHACTFEGYEEALLSHMHLVWSGWKPSVHKWAEANGRLCFADRASKRRVTIEISKHPRD